MTKVARLSLTLLTLVTMLVTHPTLNAAQAKPDAAATPVTVTVKYGGKGTVDATHKLWVWLFDDPKIGPGAIPIGELSIEKNGGTARFPNVTSKQVYVAVAYDEAGGFAGQAPPPPGSPIALFGSKTAEDPPQPVVPGPKGAVTISLTDANRMQ